MSSSLPQAALTQKVKSLPADLSKIAEEMLRAKFGVEEEVVPEMDDFFLDPSERHESPNIRQNAYRDESNVFYPTGFAERQRGFKDDIQLEIQPRDRTRYAKLRIREPRTEYLLRAMHRFDIENIRRDTRSFIMHPDFFRYILFEDKTGYINRYPQRKAKEGEENIVAEIFGCKVFVTPAIVDCILESTY